MQRVKIIGLLGLLFSCALAFAQNEGGGYHNPSIMNQFTTMEVGAGALTPRYYYNTFHKSYQFDANLRNKQAYRLRIKGNVADEKAYAAAIDSFTRKRAKVEAQNVFDRSSAGDMAWAVEKGKIESKLDIFQKNINKIMPYGGSAEDYRQWKSIYNCMITAIKVTRTSYQDLGRKKKEYVAIYKDIVKRNYHLTKQLLTWNSIKKAKEMKKNSKPPQRLSSNATIAFNAMNRWKVAMAVDGFAQKPKYFRTSQRK
ncbi:MAG: DUF5045 domain-containing protein [Prevotella sp.]|nr:DUF5045 domain-containing protein [Prevotella sp.]